ncbi:hypothetical protein [Ectopseudomonas oleovorans]|uniref:hypothetical protein n=1 Tax=Ectopseudomonas oleovorans TaxID=301 RepID=UPI00241D8F4B|nr:hypothetical protein [Pseudomonas oleovorans]
MIRGLLTILAALIPVAAQAQVNGYTLESLPKELSEDYAKTKTCEQIYDDAYLTMKLRQSGTPMPTAMEIAGEYEGLRNMVMFAYKSTSWVGMGDEYVERAAVKFGNDYYQACLTANPQGRAYFPFEKYLRTTR